MPVSDDSASLSLRCFGVGDGWPSGDRRHSAYLYRVGDTRLLVDCGDGLSQSYKASGLSYDALDGILLTHMHSDHVGGFSTFLQGLWLERRTRPLAVAAPAAGIPALQAWLVATFLSPALFGFHLRWLPLVAGQAIEVGGVIVESARTGHLDSLKAKLAFWHPEAFSEPLAFGLSGAGRRVVHSGDIGAPTDLEPLLGQTVDLLACELAHVELTELTAVLRRQRIRRAVFMHLRREFWEDRAGTQRCLAAELPETEVRVAVDGDEVEA
jgi:ribonuclease BN (tRNA processing enzyme)